MVYPKTAHNVSCFHYLSDYTLW